MGEAMKNLTYKVIYLIPKVIYRSASKVATCRRSRAINRRLFRVTTLLTHRSLLTMANTPCTWPIEMLTRTHWFIDIKDINTAVEMAYRHRTTKCSGTTETGSTPSSLASL